jgi:hypothetical protein
MVLNPVRLRVYMDQQLSDDTVVNVLVLSDGDVSVELPADDPQAALRAARCLAQQAHLFAEAVAAGTLSAGEAEEATR